ncbi:hypothetical protein [Streptomyces sp. NPDC049879]|uniref:SCO2584 family spore wall biosynthesis protein n=1 Tax=Streptomyces sp. NPDC049879 TaxID=3365598 RepID=UPI003787D3ED
MPDDVGGLPFSDGDGPDNEDRHGAADEAFAAVVLDEAFVDAAEIHEPTAAERLLYAAMERAEERADERADEGVAGEPLFYRDPDLDPGNPTGLAGFAAGDAADAFDPGRPLTDGFDGYDGFDGPDGYDPFEDLRDLTALGAAPRGEESGIAGESGDGSEGLEGPEGDEEDDDEGRFDRSDYLRYLPDDTADAPDAADAAGTAGTTAPFAGRGVPRIPPPRAAISRALPPGAGPVRWQRPVACVLAMVMGLSVLAFALIAIQRAGSFPSGDPDPLPPSPSGGPGAATGGSPGPTGVAEDAADDTYRAEGEDS